MLAGLKIYKDKRESINNGIKTRIYEIAPYVLKPTAPVTRPMFLFTCNFLEQAYSKGICDGLFNWLMMHPLDPLGLRDQRDQQLKQEQQFWESQKSRQSYHQ